MKRLLVLLWLLTPLYLRAANPSIAQFNDTGVLYVSKSGSDTTGQRGNKAYPYLTIGAAKTNAQSGDTIIVTGGTYFENDLSKNNLTILMVGGASLSYDAEDYKPGNGRGIVDDRYIGAVNFKLLGRPDVYYCTGTNSNFVSNMDGTGSAGCSNSLGAIVVTNPASRVTLDLGRVQYDSFTLGTTLGAITVTYCTNATIHADEIIEPYFGRTLLTTNVDPNIGGADSLLPQVLLVYWELGEMYFDCPHIGACEQYAIWSQEPTGNHTNSMWFKGGLVESKIYLAGHSANYKFWAYLNELRGSNSVAGEVLSIFGGRNYIFAQKISDVSVAAIGVAGGSATNVNEVWITVQKISSPTRWLQVGTNCIAHVSCQQFEDTGGTVGTTANGAGIIAQNGADLELDGQTARAAGRVLDFRGGHAVIKNLELRSTNDVAMFATNSGALLQNVLLISKTTSNSIESGTVTVTNGILTGLANRPKGANVTLSPLGTFTVDNNLQ